MKALILAAGRGNRLEDKTSGMNKCMFELNNKPIIEHNLDRASEINTITEIVIVVGYRAEEIISKYGTNYKDKQIRYVIQTEQKGLVHAIGCAKKVLAGQDFFLMLGDEVLIKSRHRDIVKEFNEIDIFGFCGVIRRYRGDSEKISKTYTIMFSGAWWINRLIEKPTYFPNLFQGTGHCIFKNEILNYIDECPIHIRRGRGEKELPDLIQCAVDNGKEIRHFIIADDYFNINTLDDLRESMDRK